MGSRLGPLIDWLVRGAVGAKTSPEVVTTIAERMCEVGIPVDRVGAFVTTLHPSVLGRAFFWQPGAPTRVLELTQALRASPTFQHSPVAHVMRTGEELRCRIGGRPPSEYAVIRELAGEGLTDYVALPMHFLGGEVHVLTFATRAAAGFSDEDLADLRSLMPPLSRIAEILALRRTAANLLSTYVGHDTGERILAGRILKGDVEVVRAAIWFSDVRGFTELSSRTTPHALIGLLNEVFDCQVPAIEKERGEVLKFIGDGLLAIFPIASDAELGARCEAALRASEAAFAALAARNANAEIPLRFGLALHVGEFAYGNVGGASRLDFTAIGDAVNLAARLEGLTGKLDRPLVVSEAFASHVTSRPLESLGSFALKGVRGEQQVLAPRA